MAVQINTLQLIVAGEINRSGIAVGSDIIKIIHNPRKRISNATTQSVYRTMDKLRSKGFLKDVSASALPGVEGDGQASKKKPVELTPEGVENFADDLEEGITKATTLEAHTPHILTFSRFIDMMPLRVQQEHFRKFLVYEAEINKELMKLEAELASAEFGPEPDEKLAEINFRTTIDFYKLVELPRVRGVMDVLIQETPELANVTIQ